MLNCVKPSEIPSSSHWNIVMSFVGGGALTFSMKEDTLIQSGSELSSTLINISNRSWKCIIV